MKALDIPALLKGFDDPVYVATALEIKSVRYLLVRWRNATAFLRVCSEKQECVLLAGSYTLHAQTLTFERGLA